MARHALLEVSADFIARLGHGCYEIVEHAVPQDVTVIAVFLKPSSQVDALRTRHCPTVVLVLEHASFMDIPDGMQLPQLAAPLVRGVRLRAVPIRIAEEAG